MSEKMLHRHTLSTAVSFRGQVPLLKEQQMADKLPKDTLRLSRLIRRHGGYCYPEGGELIAGHYLLWQVRTQVKSRRGDSSRALYQLTKAILDLPA